MKRSTDVSKELSGAGFRVPAGFRIAEDEPVGRAWVVRAIQSIGGFPVVLRASVAGEELPGALFEAQTLTDLMERIAEYRASAQGGRLRAYLSSRGLRGPVELRVQKGIQARWSGLLSTMNPISQSREEALVEYCDGPAERLSSAHFVPARVSVLLKTGKALSTEFGDVAKPLSIELLRELVEQGVEIQAQLRCSQEIEWAIDAQNQVWILQSRALAGANAPASADAAAQDEINVWNEERELEESLAPRGQSSRSPS